MTTIKVTLAPSTGRTIEAEDGASLLQVLLDHGYDVPHLCHHASVSAYGACRLCLVEVVKRGKRKLTTACNYPVGDGLEVLLDTEAVQKNRKMVLELTLSMCPDAPAVQAMAERYGLTRDAVRFPLGDETCILCGLCERVCREAVGANAITFGHRGDRRVMGTPYEEANPACLGCLACAHICPTGHITFDDGATTRTIWGREHRKVRCQQCGVAHITEAQRHFLVSKKGYKREYFDLCDACKRPTVAARLATVGKVEEQ